HTRFSRDWSSAVCSSDLRPLIVHLRCRLAGVAQKGTTQRQAVLQSLPLQQHHLRDIVFSTFCRHDNLECPGIEGQWYPIGGLLRSEERRLGQGGQVRAWQ